MATLRAYDKVPYLGRPFPQTHPNRLAVLGTLCGMSPSRIERGRVLELGCGVGANLIPLALAFPDADFLGIDLSEGHIREGRAVVEHLGLKNIELRHGDILDLDASAGTFDWIVAHGVYSWVPAAVREHVLNVVATTLAPSGLAYVGFNTNPGWLLRGQLRDQILAGCDDDDDRCARARALFDSLLPELRTRVDPHSASLLALVTELSAHEDWFLRHDLVGDWNTPFTFHAFQRHVATSGLRYVGDSCYGNLAPTLLLSAMGMSRGSTAHLEFEQRSDLITNRSHRGALLCHGGAELTDAADCRQLERMHVASPLGRRVQSFRFEVNGPDALGSLRVSESEHSPAVTLALRRLGEIWPVSLPFGDLVDDATRGEVGAEFLKLFVKGELELTLAPPRFTLTPGDRPEGCPLARYQVSSGQPKVTNRKHEPVGLPHAIERDVLAMLTGDQDLEAIAGVLGVERLAVEHAVATLAANALLLS
jgi:SAM-dependent methyltransferase